jgi:hypothetical protein
MQKRLLDRIAPDYDAELSSPIESLLSRSVEESGLTDAVARKLSAFADRMQWQGCSSKLDLLLWHVRGSKPNRYSCATTLMQDELFSLPTKLKFSWQRVLLLRVHGTKRGVPDREWLEEARCRLESLGLNEFEQRAAKWIKEMASLDEPRLTRGGTEVLRTLVCYCHLAPAPVLREAVLLLSSTRWHRSARTRKYSKKIAVSLAPLVAQAEPALALRVLRELWERHGGLVLFRWYQRASARAGVSVPDLPGGERKHEKCVPSLTSEGADNLMRECLANLKGAGVALGGDFAYIDTEDNSFVVDLRDGTARRRGDDALLVLREQLLPEPLGRLMRKAAEARSAALRTLVVVELLRCGGASATWFETVRVQ